MWRSLLKQLVNNYLVYWKKYYLNLIIPVVVKSPATTPILKEFELCDPCRATYTVFADAGLKKRSS